MTGQPSHIPHSHITNTFNIHIHHNIISATLMLLILTVVLWGTIQCFLRLKENGSTWPTTTSLKRYRLNPKIDSSVVGDDGLSRSQRFNGPFAFIDHTVRRFSGYIDHTHGGDIEYWKTWFCLRRRQYYDIVILVTPFRFDPAICDSTQNYRREFVKRKMYRSTVKFIYKSIQNKIHQ